MAIKFRPLLLIYSLLFTGCTQLLYFPDKALWGDPRVHGIQYEEYFRPSLDGTQLLFWDVKSKESPQNLVLFFHGNAQNMSAHVFNLLWLTEFQTDILAFDFRGYGLSRGTPSPQGLVKDGVMALNYAYEKFVQGHYKRLIIYAQSLGGSVALKALEEIKFKDKIDLLILDSTFRDAQQVARFKIGFLGYLMSGEKAARRDLSHITMPTLVIHAVNDPVVPFYFGKEIYEKIPTKSKELWELKSGFHGDVFSIEEGKYRQQFLKLL